MTTETGAPEQAGNEAASHARVSAIVVAALALPRDDRAAFVAGACLGDEALRADVEALLAHAGDDDDGDDPPRLDLPTLTNGHELASHDSYDRQATVQASGYRILRVIGRGGMGTVYEAEQFMPKRRVALKVIRGTGLTPEALRRFSREAHVLGRLQHPGICQVHEFGRTASGDPFIAMEFIDGKSLTEHADEAGLTRAERLALACLVCDALAHAHERGIVHRDLKPDNILVTRDGQPKILDFGIARASEMTVASTMVTSAGAIVGTVAYMSPEQASGTVDVDARSDVFSLGIVIFELLTGRRPVSVAGLALSQALHVVQQADLSLAGRGEPTLRGDLETILGRALERDPERRYAGAGELAGDIRRHLTHEPIVARPPSLAYRVSKFTRRHRTIVAAASLVILALAGGTALALREAARADTERALAVERAELAERESYRARLTAAMSASDRGDWIVAADQLARTPASRRDWEAEALQAVVDDRFGNVLLDEPTRGLALSPDGSELYTTRERDGHRELLRIARLEGRVLSVHPLDAHPVVVPRHARLLATRLIVDAARSSEPVELVAAEDGAPLATLHPCATGPPRDEELVALVTSDGLRTLERARDGLNATCDLTTGTVLRRGIDPGNHAALLPDGRSAAIAAIKEMRVVRLDTEQVVWKTPPCTDAAFSVAVNPGGSRIYTSGLHMEPFLRSWDAATGRLVAERRVEVRGGRAWAFTPDGRRVAWARDKTDVHVLDADLANETARVAVPRAGLIDLAFSPDGSRLYAATAASGLREWDLAGTPARSSPRVHSSYAYDAAFSPDGTRIASAGWDGTVKIWNPRAWSEASTLTVPVADRVFAVAWTRDGAVVLAASSAGLHRIDAVTGRVETRSLHLLQATLDTHPARDLLAVGAETGALVVDVRTLATVGQAEAARVVAWSPDGSALALATFDGGVRVLDAMPLRPRWQDASVKALAVAWRGDGSQLAVAETTQLTVRDAADGRRVASLPDPQASWCLAWSPTGRRIVSGYSEGAVVAWDPGAAEAVIRLPIHASYIKSLEFSRDGTMLATASGDGSVGIWRTGKPAR